MAKDPYRIEYTKKCPNCQCSFTTHKLNKKFCNIGCTQYGKRQTIAEANAKWLVKDPDQRKPNRDSNKVGYAFFRKKYGVKASYRHCRG